jgi:hypothetical protein
MQRPKRATNHQRSSWFFCWLVGWVIDNFVSFFYGPKNQNGDILARRSCWFIAAAKWRHFFHAAVPQFWSHDGDRNWAMIPKLLHWRCQCCWFQQSRNVFFLAIPASKITFLLRLFLPSFRLMPISEATTTTTNEMTASHTVHHRRAKKSIKTCAPSPRSLEPLNWATAGDGKKLMDGNNRQQQQQPH